MEAESARKIWDTIYKSDPEYCGENIVPSQEVIEIVTLFRNESIKRVLDVGCGAGDNLIFLLKEGFEAKGIDISHEAVRVAIKRWKRIFQDGVALPVMTGSFASLPFEDAIFGGVISIRVLQHGLEEDVRQGFREIRRVLKNNGLFFFTVPGRFDHSGKVRYCLVKTAKRCGSRVYVPTQGKEKGIPHFIFNQRIIKKLLFESGFQIERLSKECGYYKILARAI